MTMAPARCARFASCTISTPPRGCTERARPRTFVRVPESLRNTFAISERKTPVTTYASPDLIYHAEFSFACTYALSRPRLAMACARTALMAAVMMERPDLAYRVTSLMGAL